MRINFTTPEKRAITYRANAMAEDYEKEMRHKLTDLIFQYIDPVQRTIITVPSVFDWEEVNVAWRQILGFWEISEKHSYIEKNRSRVKKGLELLP